MAALNASAAAAAVALARPALARSKLETGEHISTRDVLLTRVAVALPPANPATRVISYRCRQLSLAATGRSRITREHSNLIVTTGVAAADLARPPTATTV